MSMARAIAAAKKIVTDRGFSVNITLNPIVGGDSVVVKGITSRHHIEFDQEGYSINSTNSHMLLSESALINAGIAVRDSSGNVQLNNKYTATYTDGTSTSRTYRVIEVRPSETLGLIVCILGRYGSN